MGLWGYFFICLISGLICGFIAESIATNRGMKGGFWWGFWLTIIGIIVVAVRPNDSRPMYTPSSSSSNLSNTSSKLTNNISCTSASVSASPTLVLTEKQKSSIRVYTAPENLYTPGSPIIIVEGALLKDQQTKKITALLKMKNICSKTIKAVKVKIWPLDTINTPLGDAIIYEYLDIEISRNEELGQTEEIPLPDDTTRAFRIELLRVAFADNSFWTAPEQELESLPKILPIQDIFHDNELAKQFRLEFGQSAAFAPQRIADLWFCTCGAINNDEEPVCHSCGINRDNLHEIDVEKLEAAKEKRLEEERNEQLKIEEEKRAAQEKKKEKERLEQERKEEEERLARETEEKARLAKKVKRFNWIAAIPLILFTLFIVFYLEELNNKIGIYIFGFIFVILPAILLLLIFLFIRLIYIRNQNKGNIRLNEHYFHLGCLFMILDAILLCVLLLGRGEQNIFDYYLDILKDFANMIKQLSR